MCGILCESDSSGVGAGWDLEFGHGSQGRAGQGCRGESEKWGEPWRGVDRRRGWVSRSLAWCLVPKEGSRQLEVCRQED